MMIREELEEEAPKREASKKVEEEVVVVSMEEEVAVEEEDLIKEEDGPYFVDHGDDILAYIGGKSYSYSSYHRDSIDDWNET